MSFAESTLTLSDGASSPAQRVRGIAAGSNPAGADTATVFSGT
jgi:hypothetical protein